MASSSGSARQSHNRAERKPAAAGTPPAQSDPGSPEPGSRAAPRRADQRGEPLPQVAFLTVAEVADVMRVSKMTVYRLVHAGDLMAVRVGRSFRVPEQAVHDYLRDAYIEAG